MQKVTIISLAIILSLTSMSSAQTGAVPNLISYQGHLVDDQGDPLDGDYQMIFAIYDALTDGELQWTSGEQTVSVENGLFTYDIGSVVALPADLFSMGVTRYLSVTVSGEEIQPRTRLCTVPYSFYGERASIAEMAELAFWVECEGCISSQHIEDNTITTDDVLDGTISLADLGQNGAEAGQSIQWNGTAWMVTDAGGDITGVTAGDGLTGGGESGDVSLSIGPGAVTETMLGTNSVNGDKIQNKSVPLGDLASSGASSGQIIQYQTSEWQAVDMPAGGGSGWILSGSDIIEIDTTDYVGIGTGNADYNLDVHGVVRGTGRAMFGPDHTCGSNDGNFVAGSENTVDGSQSVVSGGRQNTAWGSQCAVGGGFQNVASGAQSSIAGGRTNETPGDYAFIGGGRYNNAQGAYSAVVGGGGSSEVDSNSAIGDYSFVGGGQANRADGDHDVVGGGSGNRAGHDILSSGYCFIGSGEDNNCYGFYSVIGGGSSNMAKSRSAIAGGLSNQATGNEAFVGCGRSNEASGDYSSVVGGRFNTATGLNSTVLGGEYCEANGDYSVATGYKARANHTGSFVFSDNSGDYFSSQRNNTFIVYASGGVGIGTSLPVTDLDVNGSMVLRGDCLMDGYLTTNTFTTDFITLGRPTQYGQIFDATLELGGFNSHNGAILLNDAAFNTPIELNANTGMITTKTIDITGGGDIAEPFPISDDEAIPEGALVVIDELNPGQLKMSNTAYDTRIAGIISGAGGVNPGLTLSQEGVLDEGQHVALSGRVYALADASFGAIQPGDFLTTSSTPGHAMKASDRDRAYGTVIGKAMSSLESGRGLVLVLVNLQ